MTTYTITGKLINSNKQPLSGLSVEAWDKDLIFDDLAGVAVSDAAGKFHISFTEKHFSEWFLDRKPDLFFKVFDGDKLLCDTRKDILWNLKEQHKEVLITVPMEISPEEPPVLNKDTVLKLADHARKTPETLQASHPEIYKLLLQKAHHKIQEELNQFFETSSEALRSFIQALDLSSLVPDRGVKGFITNIISNSQLADELRQEGLSRIINWDKTANLNALLQPQNPVNVNPLLQNEMRQATVYRISGLAAFNDTLAEKLIAHELSLPAINPEKIEELISQKLLTEAEGGEFLLATNVYALAGEDIKLAGIIKKETESSPCNRLLILLRWDWTIGKPL